jgi:hypothetical protein
MISKRVGLLLFATLTILEGLVNSVIYLLFLENIVGVADFALPFYFKWFKYGQDS